MKFTYLSFPSVSSKSSYKQGHPCLPDDFFRMLICGPSNSGKTNLLLNMIYSLLMFDKINLFSKNLHQYQYQGFLKDFVERINPKVGYEVIEAYDDEIIPLEELPADNQKIVVFDDLLCEKNQNSIINYFINGRHKNCCVIYLSQTFYKVPKDIRVNCSHLCIFRLDPKENKRIANEIGVDHNTLDRATDEKYSFLYYDKPKKSINQSINQSIDEDI